MHMLKHIVCGLHQAVAGPLLGTTGLILTGHRTRRISNESIQSGFFDSQQAATIKEVKKRWWGNKRLGDEKKLIKEEKI